MVEKRGDQEPRDFVEQRGPFTVLERNILYERFGKQFIVDVIRRPDGTIGEYSWLKFIRPAVLIFPLDNARNIYLTEEFTYATNRYSIEVAGGSIDPGESAEEAARREVKAELGMEVDSLYHLGTLWEITSPVYNKTHLYLARVASVGEAKPESGEVIRLKRVPFDDACRMILDGRISTASVVAGIMRIRDLLEHPEALDRPESPIVES